MLVRIPWSGAERNGMDAKVFRMAILTIISAFILVAVIIYATNADRINRLFGKGDQNEASDSASIEMSVVDEAAYGQQIGDDLKAFLYDDDFFDEAEEIPSVVVIQQNTKKADAGDEASSEPEEELIEDGSNMAVVGQLDNPDALASMPGGMFPDGTLPGTLTEPPIEGTPVGTLP